MWFIITLVIVGVLLLVAELILLPGITVAGICAFISFLGAVYIGFTSYGKTGGYATILAIVVLAVTATMLSLRSKTWRRLSLKQEVEGTSQPLPQETVREGQRGRTITRLAPSGNVLIDGKTYEARSLGDVYVDPNTAVQVTGFENFTVIVKVLMPDAGDLPE
ncbi:MAG: NfeD family protein [Rikenellaceae bacterium]|nr:NfeD family protein [Rikenellaceae bacterium]